MNEPRLTVTGTGRWQECWINVKVEGVEPMRGEHDSPKTPLVRPYALRIAWSRGNFGSDWKVKRVMINGTNVKRDGSAGAQRQLIYYGLRTVPDWVRAFEAEHDPGRIAEGLPS